MTPPTFKSTENPSLAYWLSGWRERIRRVGGSAGVVTRGLRKIPIPLFPYVCMYVCMYGGLNELHWIALAEVVDRYELF